MISREDVIAYSAPLADKVALSTSDREINEIADQIASLIADASTTQNACQTNGGQIKITVSLAPRIYEELRRKLRSNAGASRSG